MTTPNENDVQGQQQDTTPDVSGTDDNASQQQDNSDDLYAQYLEKFPTSLHPVAREVFKEWDGNVTRRIQAKEAEYEPYKPFVEQYEPDAIQQAIQFAEAMERDPQRFIEAVANAYGITPQQAMEEIQDAQQQDTPEFDLSDPAQQRLAQHEEILRSMAQTLLSEREQREQALLMQQQEEQYEATMKQLSEKYGEFDVDYVNVLLANGADPDAAVQHWKQRVEQFAKQQLTPNNTAPVIMGAGGGTPSIQRDVETISSKETRSLVEQMLRAAKEG